MFRFHALVVFDLDGTLLRGRTVCEVLAEPLGRFQRMREIERITSHRDDLRAAREEMAAWYRPVGLERLRGALDTACFAPGVADGLALLRSRGVAVGIASITWSFAVEHFARRLGVDHWQGTGLDASGDIRHVWPENKGTWVRDFARAIGVPRERTAAVGDSRDDAAMLDAVRIPVFVGLEPPSGTGWLHRPAADIDAVCRELVDLWQLPEPMSAKVERRSNLADTGFDALLVESEQAGVRFLRRLADEWASGANRFDRLGEVLFGARVGGELVAVGGLNLDPYTRKAQVGRVRHVYVGAAYRRLGIGRELVAAIVATAHGRFETLRLSTANPAAARFYERLGFRPQAGDAHCTHVLALTALE